MTFLCIIALRNKAVAHTFLPSFDNGNGRLSYGRLLTYRKLATMVTCRHNSLLYYEQKQGTFAGPKNTPAFHTRDYTRLYF